jgi:hypothetical protein
MMQINTICRLVRESRYPIDEAVIAEAILARITMPQLTPPLGRPSRSRMIRSFHPTRQASSFRLARPRRGVWEPYARLA